VLWGFLQGLTSMTTNLNQHLNPRERGALRLRSAQYRLIKLVLFCVNYDGVLLRCLEHEDADKVLKELHDGPASGNFARNTTVHKILRDVYYWPTLFKEAHTYIINCKTFQIIARREKRASIPLLPVSFSRPFKQWGLEIIGEITPISSKQHRYIQTPTNYFMKWAEAIPLTHVNEKVVIKFIEQQIIMRFSVPSVLVFDNASCFYSTLLKEFSLDKGIIIKYPSNYYPQGNGVAE
jgi:hypothetical protein